MLKRRLDDLLVERRIAEDRKKATAIILSGIVLVDEQRVDKPGTRIASSSAIRIKTTDPKYVSRGGLKLEAALCKFAIPVQGKICLDLGASTGGFTDCLLQHGARKVYAFDVGRGQLHWKLRQDPRVVIRDGSNVRYLAPSMVDDPVDLISVDVVFISLRLVLPPLKEFPGAQIVALVKPQFEARRRELGERGIIESVNLQQQIVGRVKDFAEKEGFNVLGETPSPIQGQKGNQEYFLHLRLGTTSIEHVKRTQP
jgi:23S rRNA (cytidine1920-2'-O)/16S rRNA (cytidine1409-2'-O)-methyltransferase